MLSLNDLSILLFIIIKIYLHFLVSKIFNILICISKEGKNEKNKYLFIHLYIFHLFFIID